jgi:hypothetical protein
MGRHENIGRSFKRRFFNKQDLFMVLLILINLGTFLTVCYPYYLPLLIKYNILR